VEEYNDDDSAQGMVIDHLGDVEKLERKERLMLSVNFYTVCKFQTVQNYIYS
jgi:hypothetical protein